MLLFYNSSYQKQWQMHKFVMKINLIIFKLKISTAIESILQ
jgi:hypothetical protein